MPGDEELEKLGAAATAIGPTQPSQPAAVAQTAPAPPTSVIADRYEIVALLGMGGMGRVYRVHDKKLDETVALKMLRRELLDTPGVLERFRQEVKLARRVTHTHVVRTFDLGEHGADHYLTMEYIDGRSLAQLLDDGPLALDRVVDVARAIATGIAAAHATGVLHRDLKPDNVLVAKTGRIAITDFGIAMASTSPTSTADRFVGTPAYMAPEQLEQGATIAAPTDVYAFGTILFEMLTGRRPFLGTDPLQVAIARLHQAPPDPRSIRPVPDALAELALACMARRPQDRPRDGEAILLGLAAQHDVGARPRTQPPAADVPTRTSRSVAILPLRATGDLAEIAEGLSEELVDALSSTRSLRVRPLASVRKVAKGDADAREIGEQLGVDVVVEGSLRQRGGSVRIAARVVGVADGFQLWASHVDAGADGILAASDDIVESIARALTVDLAMPERATVDPRATALYLEGKAKARAAWIDGQLDPGIEDLEQALLLAPDDPQILAMLAQALARSAFYGAPATHTDRARTLAARAVSLAPELGEAHLAVGIACLYGGALPESAAALARAVRHAPGSAMAQALFGASLLEAGALHDALSHLEASRSLDPLGPAHIDLPRAFFYADRWPEVVEEFERARRQPDYTRRVFDEVAFARLKMWRGQLEPLPELPMFNAPANVAEYALLVRRIHAAGTLSAETRALLTNVAAVENPRLRASRSQFAAEYLMLAGDADEALRFIGIAVDAGLQDYLWLQKCPMLAPLRGRPDFQEIDARLGERARAVLTAARS